MNYGVECFPHQRRYISNWLIEFIIRYWKSEKASQTSAKFHIHPDWSEKNRKILRSGKCTKAVSQIEPHRFPCSSEPKYGWWIWANRGIVQIWQNIPPPSLSNSLHSCWLHSDCSQNILGKMSQVKLSGTRLAFLEKICDFLQCNIPVLMHYFKLWSSCRTAEWV